MHYENICIGCFHDHCSSRRGDNYSVLTKEPLPEWPVNLMHLLASH